MYMSRLVIGHLCHLDIDRSLPLLSLGSIFFYISYLLYHVGGQSLPIPNKVKHIECLNHKGEVIKEISNFITQNEFLKKIL